MSARTTETSARAVGGAYEKTGYDTRTDQTPVPEIYLHPGRTYASKEPARISMILGSCVGVCLFDRRLAIGGATHYMLAKWQGIGEPSSRYGDIAINTLIEQLQVHGSHIPDLQAMVFGGARMFDAFEEQSERIGTRNVVVAMEILERHAIGVVNKNVGGERGRKLRMDTKSGAVVVSLIGEKSWKTNAS